MTEGKKGYDAPGGGKTAPAERGSPTIGTAGIRFELHGRSHPGRVRPTNQDAFLIADLATGRRLEGGGVVRYRPDPAGLVCAVSDGMGGARAGDVASRLSVETLLAALLDSRLRSQDPQTRLRETIRRANTVVFERAAADRSCRGMGTTLTALLVLEGCGYLGHVGDSRAYLLHRGALRQLTRDHSLVNFLVEYGYLSPERAADFARRNVILEAVGVKPDVTVDTGAVTLGAGDLLLLCSDGLYGVLTDGELADLLGTEEDLERLTARLVAEANARGGPDNVTVVVCRVAAL